MASTDQPMPANQIKILLMEKISQQAVACFEREGYTVVQAVKYNEDELIEAIQGVHAIGVRSKTKMTKKVLEAAKDHLKTVGCFCIGTDQVDLEYAKALGIPTFNAPYANTRSVSELVIAEIIMLARQAGDRSRECHEGVWNKVSANCYEVRGKTLGIVGYGHVGSQLSILAEAMGMQVYFYDIENKLALGNATPTNSLKELCEKSQFITLHVPALESTVNLIGKTEIEYMQKGSYLINAARGKVVDVEAAADALKSGHLAGGAFDVYPVEPAGKVTDFKVALQNCPNVILTPHIGGSTEEAQAAIGVEVATKIIQFLNRGCTMGAVNYPEIQPRRKLVKGNTRVLVHHENKQGSLQEINQVLSVANINSQILDTAGDYGYLVVDLDTPSMPQIQAAFAQSQHTISTRVLYSGKGYVGEHI